MRSCTLPGRIACRKPVENTEKTGSSSACVVTVVTVVTVKLQGGGGDGQLRICLLLFPLLLPFLLPVYPQNPRAPQSCSAECDPLPLA